MGGRKRDNVEIWWHGARIVVRPSDLRGLSAGIDAADIAQLVQRTIADDASNSDKFWFAPDVTIMDAQHSDILTYRGIVLTGGDGSPSSVGTNDNEARRGATFYMTQEMAA